MSFLVKAYQFLTDGLVSENTPWYKQPFFILGVVLVGVAVFAYYVYLQNRIDTLQNEKAIHETEAIRYKGLLKETKHKQEARKLRTNAKQAERKVRNIGKTLRRLETQHQKIEESIDKAETVAGLRDAQEDIEDRLP